MRMFDVPDAFAMEGESKDGLEAPKWMNDWTIFYWGWWIAWSPFVGMFIAKISKGNRVGGSSWGLPL